MENPIEPLDENALEIKIKEIVSAIENDAATKPEELEKIKALIKKNVPFFTRSAFAAYLLREVAKGGERKARVEHKRERRESAPVQKVEKEKTERAGAKTLYLNIGKMKHLYAKNLSQLLQSELHITRDDIYSLRIHDKYSFITMSEENCNKAIEVLNGKEINGRKAELSFSNR